MYTTNEDRMRTRFVFILLGAAIMMTENLRAQKFEGLALTPPMGWNS